MESIQRSDNDFGHGRGSGEGSTRLHRGHRTKYLGICCNVVFKRQPGKQDNSVGLSSDAFDSVSQDPEHLVLQDIERDSSRLEPAADDLRRVVDSLTGANQELEPMVENATRHAAKLALQAERLKR